MTSELRDLNYFKQVRIASGAVLWPHEQDFCPDTLYERSRKLPVMDNPEHMGSEETTTKKPLS